MKFGGGSNDPWDVQYILKEQYETSYKSFKGNKNITTYLITVYRQISLLV